MELAGYLKFVAALVFVLGLILGLAWVARRFGLMGGIAARPGTKKRLSLGETLSVGPRHRVVLIRRDDVEHLVLIGPAGETLIENGIPVSAVENQVVPEADAGEGV